MLLKCLISVTALQVISCIHLEKEFYPNGKLSSQRKNNINYDVIDPSLQFATDLTGTNVGGIETDKSYFPDVIYPTSIIDIAEPFYYKANIYDDILRPFDEDVISSYKAISSNSQKTKINNSPKSIEDEKRLCKPIVISLLKPKNNNTNEQKDQKILIYRNEECEKVYNSENNDRICLEETIFNNETISSKNNETESYQEDELNYQLNSNDSETKSNNESNQILSLETNDCNISSSTECENITDTDNVSSSSSSPDNVYDDDTSSELTPNTNSSLPDKTKPDDHYIQVRVKIHIEVSKVDEQTNVNVTKKSLEILPYEISEYIPNNENQTILDGDEQFKSRKYSAEEINTISEDILNLLLNSSNNTDLVFTELLTKLLFLESSEECENFYSLLQLLNVNNLNVTKVDSELNEIKYNVTNDQAHIETLKINFENDNNSSNSNDENSTTENRLEDDVDERDFFLDFIISLDTLCQENDTILSDNQSDYKQKYIVINSTESSSEED